VPDKNLSEEPASCPPSVSSDVKATIPDEDEDDDSARSVSMPHTPLSYEGASVVDVDVDTDECQPDSKWEGELGNDEEVLVVNPRWRLRRQSTCLSAAAVVLDQLPVDDSNHAVDFEEQNVSTQEYTRRLSNGDFRDCV
jgi:hypothetical protein